MTPARPPSSAAAPTTVAPPPPPPPPPPPASRVLVVGDDGASGAAAAAAAAAMAEARLACLRPVEFFICRMMTSDGAAGAGVRASPHTSPTTPPPAAHAAAEPRGASCVPTETGSVASETSAREQKTSVRYQRRPCSTTLYTSTAAERRSTTTSLTVPSLARPASSAARHSPPKSEKNGVNSARSARYATRTGSRASYSHAVEISLTYGFGNGSGARYDGPGADQRCRSWRRPTRRSHCRCGVARTSADWKEAATASAPKTVRKSSNVSTISVGSTCICLCAEAEYSPSCTLTST